MNTSVATPKKKEAKSPVVANKAPAATRVVFVYGTLKKGFYNNDYWFGDAKYLRGDTVGGFVMLDLGPYPAIAKLNIPGASGFVGVTGELWEVPEEAYQAVKRMEEGAGYHIVEAVTDGGVKVEVFAMHEFGAGDYSWTKTGEKKKDSKVTVAQRLPF